MMIGARSARGRALAASVVLLLFLISLTVVATWRTQSDRGRREELEQRAAIVAALEEARAQFFRGATLITAAVFEEDPTALVESYQGAQEVGDRNLEQARAGMVAIGETDGVSALDDFADRIALMREQVDAVLAFGASADRATRVQLGAQYYPQMWPQIESMMAELEDLSGDQQAESVAASAAADRASDASFAILIISSGVALLGGAAIIILLVVSVVKPLSMLQASAKAVASGDLDAMVKVSGPSEVASLARDFNEMVDQRKRVEAVLREGEAKYRHFFESILDIFYRTDSRGIITEISPSVERFGYTREQLIGSQVMDLYENPEQRSALVKAILEHGKLDDYEIRLRRGDGQVIDISVSAHPLRTDDGTFAGTEGTLRDITERKRAEQALRDSEERTHAITQTAMDAIIMMDNNGSISYWNPAAERLFGYSTQEALGKELHPLLAPAKYLPASREGLSSFKTTGQGAAVGRTLEISAIRRDGTEFPVELSISRVQVAGIWHAVGVVRDISDRKAAEEALRDQARRDPLTGVLNHGAIVDQIRDLILSGESRAPWAVAMIDVDRLKEINDNHGHQVGDSVLTAIASSLSSEGTLVGRYGGDEFIAILTGVTRREAEQYRADVARALSGAAVIDPQTGKQVPAEASIGLAVYPDDATTLAGLIKASDEEMYAVKRERPHRRSIPRKQAA